MVSLTCTTQSTDGVTLVTGRLTGGAVAHRVRVANRLDGPVWPPRREGVPEAGWEDDGYTAVVPAGETVAVGYASPASPTDPPLEIVEREIASDDEATETTPSDAVRELGDPSPPRDAVPVPIDDAPEPPAQADSAPDPRSRSPADSATPDPVAPESVATWLDDVERRVDLVERLAAARSVPAATTALREAGSLDDAAALVDAVEDDRAALAAVAERGTGLADRADAADVPLESLRRLA